MLMSYHAIAAAIDLNLYTMKDDPFSPLSLRLRDQIKPGRIRSPENNPINKRIGSDDAEFDWLYPKHFHLSETFFYGGSKVDYSLRACFKLI
jgi:hypothetical protein